MKYTNNCLESRIKPILNVYTRQKILLFLISIKYENIPLLSNNSFIFKPTI